MKKVRKYIFRGFMILLGILLLLMIGIFVYVSLNKKKIINQVTTDISKKINGVVTIKNVELSFFTNFPKISVLLHDVMITDTMYSVHKHPFLQANKVFAELSITRLFKKQSPLNGLKVNRGTLYIYTDTSGYSNDYLFKQKKDSVATAKKTESENELRSVELNDFRVVIEDRKKEKLHDLRIDKIEVGLDDKDARTFMFEVDATIRVESLAFNLPRGSFLKGKTFKGNFDLKYDKQLKQLVFDSIDVKLETQPFNLSGRFDLSGTAPQFDLKVHTRNIVYDNAKSFLPARIARSLSLVTIRNPLDASAFINGPLKGGEPLINITWSSKEVHLATPFLDFDEAKFTGFFTNEVVKGLPRNDPNSQIVINNFSALWHNLPVHANRIEISNLSTPTLTCDLKSEFPLIKMNELLGASSLELTSGDAIIDMAYSGPIEKNDKTNSFLNGSIRFRNGTLLYAPRAVEMKQVNATMIIKNSDVFIDSFRTVVLNNSFLMQGVAKNLLTLINTETANNINIDWNIYSPSLDLTPFTYLLSSRKKTSATKPKTASVAQISSKIDSILDQGKLHVSLKTNKLTYRKFQAENVVAKVSLLSDSYIINDVSMNHAGGKMNLNGSLKQVQNNNLAKVNMDLNNVDVTRLFRAFENFGQDGVTAESLEGKLTAKVTGSLTLNENGKVNPSSLVSVVDFSLKNGALNNYEPIKEIQRFIFKKRDFDNIRFAELKNRLEVKNREIKINRMEIQSTILTMFVEGLYSQKGNTDLSIQVPLNNLKKRDSTYNPKNLGVNQKVGRSVFLRGRPGPDGDVKFSLDLFNKYNKEKNK